MNQDELDEVKVRMSEYMELAKTHHEVDMIYFMLTNILSESTELLCYGTNAAETASRAFGKRRRTTLSTFPVLCHVKSS